MDEDKAVAAELHAIRYYGGEPAVNRPGLSCAGTFEAHGITDWENIDFNSLMTQVETQAENTDDVTDRDTKKWCPSMLDPTQGLVYDYIQDTWFPQSVVAFVLREAQPRHEQSRARTWIRVLPGGVNGSVSLLFEITVSSERQKLHSTVLSLLDSLTWNSKPPQCNA